MKAKQETGTPRKPAASGSLPNGARIDPRLGRDLLITRLGLVIAAGVSTYLLIHALTHEQLGGCGPGSACDRVLGSHWAYLGPVPVSAPALFTYVSLFILSFRLAPATSTRFRPKPWWLAAWASSAIIAAALWFVGLQVLKIGAVCKFCVTAHVAGCVAAAACLRAVLKNALLPRAAPQPQPAPPAPTRGSPRAQIGMALLAGVGVVVALGAVQWRFPHRLNMVRVHQGSLKLDLQELPRLGSESATRVVVSLFDYTCPDCQEMHKHLQAALKRYPEELGIASLPLPLDSKCNPMVRRTQAKHQQACEYARLGLALRRIGNKAFIEYDSWFFSHDHTPALAECEAKAKAIAGAEALARAATDPWVEKTLQIGVSLYELNGNITRSYRMPQLVIGDRVNVGPLASAQDLYELLERHLGVIPPK